MPVIRQINAERGIDIGGIPDTRVNDGIGRGLQQLGGALGDMAQAREQVAQRQLRMQQEMDEFRTTQDFQRWNDDNELEYAKTQQGIDPSGAGFTDTVSSVVTNRSEAFLKNVPESLRPKFQELVTTAREQWLNKAAAAEIDQRNTWYRTGITERQTALQTQVFNSPDQFQPAVDDAFRTIDASGLPPVEKEALKKKTQEMFALAVGEADIRAAEADPTSIASARERLGVPTSGVDQFVDRIITVESGGDANAKNPNSSATGAGQFISSTWLNMIRKYRPDIAAGRSAEQILSLRSDFGLSKQMTKAYAQENADFLAAQGLAQTPGNIYLAHFLGPRGAAQVLKADAGASVASIVGQDAVRANGFLAGRDVAWLRNWAAKKMGGKGGGRAAADPRYASLTLDQRLSLFDQMNAAAQRGQTAIDAQTKASYDSMKGALELGIQAGDVSSPMQITQSGLSAAHKADLLSALRTRRGDEMAVAEAVAQFQAGTLTVDPLSTEGKKTVDGIYGVLSKAVPADQLQYATENLVARAGVVPQGAHNALRAGLESNNPNDVAQAAQQALRVNDINASILGRRDGGSKIADQAVAFRHLTETVGLSAQQAAQRIIDARDPEKVRARASLMDSKPVKDHLKNNATESTLRNIFDPGMFGFDPELGQTPSEAAAMVGEYRTILEESIFDAGGDLELGDALAAERFSRTYGTSGLTLAGSGVVTRLPPEKVYPSGPDGTHSYISDQVREALGAEGVMAEDVFLQAYPDTQADVRAGRPARYQVWYRENGQLQMYNLPFYAEPPQGSGQVNLDANRAARDQNRNDLLQSRDRDATLDQFLAGPPQAPAAPIAPMQPSQPATPQTQLQDQRRQLFNDAQDGGVLQGAMP